MTFLVNTAKNFKETYIEENLQTAASVDRKKITLDVMLKILLFCMA